MPIIDKITGSRIRACPIRESTRAKKSKNTVWKNELGLKARGRVPRDIKHLDCVLSTIAFSFVMSECHMEN